MKEGVKTMANLVDREEVLDVIFNIMTDNKVSHKHRALNRNIKQVAVTLTNTERHAHWNDNFSFKSNAKRVDICSCCKSAIYRDIDSDKYNYCPTCGCKMDEKTE